MIPASSLYNWKEQKSKLKKKFSALTDTNKLIEEVKKDEILSKLQLRLGLSKEEVIRIISEL